MTFTRQFSFSYASDLRGGWAGGAFGVGCLALAASLVAAGLAVSQGLAGMWQHSGLEIVMYLPAGFLQLRSQYHDNGKASASTKRKVRH